MKVEDMSNVDLIDYYKTCVVMDMKAEMQEAEEEILNRMTILYDVIDPRD